MILFSVQRKALVSHLDMEENNKKTSISKASTLEEIGEFWDNHSLADYWDQTEEAEFKIRATRRHRITIDPELYDKITSSSYKRGILPHLHLSLFLPSPELKYENLNWQYLNSCEKDNFLNPFCHQ
ncbi:MAG: hypothetical protein U9N60_09825 [Thermodesulfobacteriota bacterium]|nr:hypothetical protein [Thermodesulfobacteriota bacterium]